MATSAIPSGKRSPLLDEDFVNEDHIIAFEKALNAPDLSSTPDNLTSPLSGGTDDRSPGLDANGQRPYSDMDANGLTSSANGRENFTEGSGEAYFPNGEANSRQGSRKGSAVKFPPGLSGGEGSESGRRGVEKLRAVSDFAPIHSKVKKRSNRHPKSQKQGWSYHFARYPLLLLLLLFIATEFSIYVLVRQIVNVFEFLLAWTGHKRVIRKKLREAESYDAWKKAALEMDEYLGFDEWKQEDEDSQYDYSLVRKVKRSLSSLRAQGDTRGIMEVLNVCLRPNFGGTERGRLYSETFYGTKNLIEAYIQEISLSLACVRESTTITAEEKKKFFKSATKNFGSTALCLSGGASFGYYHFGLCKAFLEKGLLPRVVTGTSAGALVAALICTRTNDELKELLVPELADRITACEESMGVWIRRFMKTGARFDTLNWARKATFFTHGSLTFREAYERTGRASTHYLVLNVSVIPHDRHSPTKLLNYLTSPDCVIWSAIIASAAVPGILNPVVLMTKTRMGVVPWNWGSRFKDGSLRVDIPLQSLHLLFNVNHSIVSQVNPHVHLFFFAPRGSAGRPVAHRKGRGWRGGFILSAIEQYLKLELTKNFKVIRDLELMPTMLGQDWSGVFLQKFEGTITIWPKTRFMDWIHILTDPDRVELRRMLDVGQRAAWPKLHMISNRDKIEGEITRGRKAVRRALRQNRLAGSSNYASGSTMAGGASPQLPARDDHALSFSDTEVGAFILPPGGGQENSHLLSRDSSGEDIPALKLPVLPPIGSRNNLRSRAKQATKAKIVSGGDSRAQSSDEDISNDAPSGNNSISPTAGFPSFSSSLRQFRKRTKSFPSFSLAWPTSPTSMLSPATEKKPLPDSSHHPKRQASGTSNRSGSRSRSFAKRVMNGSAIGFESSSSSEEDEEDDFRLFEPEENTWNKGNGSVDLRLRDLIGKSVTSDSSK